MLKKIITLVSSAVFSLLLLSGAANAIPVTPNFVMNFNNDTGVGVITDSYTFESTGFTNLSFITSVNHPNAPGGVGINTLVMTWTVGNIIHNITDALGQYNGPLTFFHALADGESGTLNVTGTFFENGGGYTLTVAAVPLPPAVIAFGTAMLGVGFLARRKRKKKEVFS